MADRRVFGKAPDPLDRYSVKPTGTTTGKRPRSKGAVIGLFAIGAIVAVIASASINPPISDQHAFTSASDYNEKKDSGCTNSGAGCHDEETSYQDFNAYHPNAECTSCHEYQGVGCIPCHAPADHECPVCHDGSMRNAGDRVRLQDPYPRGHYRETTHTAMGTDFKQEVRAAARGEAKATCKDCHSRSLEEAHDEIPEVAGSKYGSSIGCGECHNDVRAFGQAEVVADWESRECESCHKVGSSSPMHGAKVVRGGKAKSSAGCATSGDGCHGERDIHAAHADKPANCSGSAAKGEPGCHNLDAQADKPLATTCGESGAGSCHRAVGGAFQHENENVHAPTTDVPASDTSFASTACGSCHRMDPDGTSLIDEHDLATSARSSEPANGCANCHNDPASVATVKDDWSARNTGEACESCHGAKGLDAPHLGDQTALHTSDSPGCAESGMGCHPTDDLSEVGAPTTVANVHEDCLRCHDWREADGNVAYDPESITCGSGRDCHTGSNPDTDIHVEGGVRIDGTDARHSAGAAQASATMFDAASGRTSACKECHQNVLGDEHARTNVTISFGMGTLCERCHNRTEAVATTVKTDWPGKGTADACEACHAAGTGQAIHTKIETAMVATELNALGVPQAGYCGRSGCHGTADVRKIHSVVGCGIIGCHKTTGDISSAGVMTCGGLNAATSCHVGFSTVPHDVDHSADLTGTVNGVTYTEAANIGCFGCHYDNLRAEHSDALLAGSTDGSPQPATTCGLCHADVDGAGPNASLPAVKAAIANRDHRCIACHQSGSAADGPNAVASPHRVTSTSDPLVAGAVWTDPFGDWKTAWESVTGGGHNALSQSIVGASAYKKFPRDSFSIETTSPRWVLPYNGRTTLWLRPDRYPQAISTTDPVAVSSPASATPRGQYMNESTLAVVQGMTVKCDDCHLTPDMAGPQGAAVKIVIDPAYSQTEYANPTPGTYQFDPMNVDPQNGDNPAGYKPVICYKCHTIFAGSVPGTLGVGGNGIHRTHASRHKEMCTTCHIRVPHAWKRPRLLPRAVATTDGVTPDTWPYVSANHKGLVGFRFVNVDDPTKVTRDNCITGGCYSSYYAGLTPPQVRPESPTQHPTPSSSTTLTYWP